MDKKQARINYVNKVGVKNILSKATPSELLKFTSSLLGFGRHGYTPEEKRAFKKNDDFLMTVDKNGLRKFSVTAKYHDGWQWRATRITIKDGKFRIDTKVWRAPYNEEDMLWTIGEWYEMPQGEWHIWDVFLPDNLKYD